jgi:iron complex outermembrane receptor protein
VTGGEIEAVARQETRVSVPDLADFGDNLKASTLRLAAYAQDEWQLNPNWGVHAGLRWEGITTHGDTGQSERPKNTSSVWTPLLHAVWKPDPKSRDQVRVSLTRSYRSPPLGALIARPSINREFPVSPVDQANRETYPDSAGNPDLKPELATGIDVALERYLEGGGVLSANVFHRNISNLIRGSVAQEDVSWSVYPRWVRRQRNIGDASTSGIELEAKFRLDQVITGAPGVELRSNLALYRSRVKQVPGPDNRLDQQAKASGNIGADYRLRGLPLTLGGNFNWVPATTTRLDVDQTSITSTKRVWDLFTLWTVNPALGVRLMASNLDPHDYISTSINGSTNVVTGKTERSTSESTNMNYTNWQLRLEMKL